MKAAKEQTAKVSRMLVAARPGRTTTTVAPPAGAPPGPVLAEVTELPQDDGGDEKSEPKPDTAAAEPPTNQ